VGILFAIMAGVAIIAVGVVLFLFRGIDEDQAARISQTRHDRSDDAGGQVDGADKGPPAAAV